MNDILAEYNNNALLAFDDGVWYGLQLWDALQYGIHEMDENEADEKLNTLYYTILDTFEKKFEKKLDELELKDMLYQLLMEDFNVVIEDNSIDWITNLFIQLYTDCVMNRKFDGVFQLYEQFENINGKDTRHQPNRSKDDDQKTPMQVDDDNDSKNNTDTNDAMIGNNNNNNSSNNNNDGDDDGWTTVTSKRKKGRKKGRHNNK